MPPSEFTARTAKATRQRSSARLPIATAWRIYRPAAQARRARHDFAVFRRFVETAAAAGHPVKGERVLDVGCGFRFPVTLLLHSYGAIATGIDTEFVARRLSARRLWTHLVQHGVTAFARRLVRETIHKSVYFRTLRKALGAPLRFEGLDLRHTRLEALTEERQFDLVFSNDTFEHLPDVERAVQIVARVLKPGGLAYVSIHLFPSLSGGHELAYSLTGTSEVVSCDGRVPWQHLRDPSWQPPTYLNRMREHEYRAIFEKYLNIREWRSEYWEPERFLTEEVQKELPAYTREELLKRSVVAVAEG